ncbi:MAG: phenylacetate-CoA oxygenase subunit PaaC [Saprospiraceae bacterium]|nr:phenylacetate-CoA oxygenase subunit PaaC [Saprospiraceae bacterium]
MNQTDTVKLVNYLMFPADNVMILGQRLGEWCGHGPVLEQDIALTNIALDLIGEARNYYQYAAGLSGKSEDDFPFHRNERQFKNVLLVEQPNGNWGDTLMRQCMFDCFHYFFLDDLKKSSDERLSAIASKSFKEAGYHLRFSSEWVIRLGDGTDESHDKMQKALDRLIVYFEELFMPDPLEQDMAQLQIAPDLAQTAIHAKAKFREIIEEATLKMPENVFFQKGGKQGLHTENMGYILADMQYLQKTYPGAQW